MPSHDNSILDSTNEFAVGCNDHAISAAIKSVPICDPDRHDVVAYDFASTGVSRNTTGLVDRTAYVNSPQLHATATIRSKVPIVPLARKWT